MKRIGLILLWILACGCAADEPEQGRHVLASLECDFDGDGFESVDCGGNDCDDSNPDVYPGHGGCPDPCDQDGDGYRSRDCGGNDCDDKNPNIFPGTPTCPHNGGCVTQSCNNL